MCHFCALCPIAMPDVSWILGFDKWPFSWCWLQVTEAVDQTFIQYRTFYICCTVHFISIWNYHFLTFWKWNKASIYIFWMHAALIYEYCIWLNAVFSLFLWANVFFSCHPLGWWDWMGNFFTVKQHWAAFGLQICIRSAHAGCFFLTAVSHDAML